MAYVAVYDRHGFFMYSRRFRTFAHAKLFADRADREHGLEAWAYEPMPALAR